MNFLNFLDKFPDLKILGYDTEKSKFIKDFVIKGIYHDSRLVKVGGLFFAIGGESLDGYNYIEDAIENGAKIVIFELKSDQCEDDFIEVNNEFPEVIFLISKDIRRDISMVAAEYYDNPSKDLIVIGVTGTNGKTTTAWIIHHLLKSKWGNAGLISTIFNDLGGFRGKSTHTTPDPISLQEILSKIKENGCKSVVMEVSSHALEQKRCDGVFFNIVIFHNLTQDHLDYHGNLDNYFQAKAKLFKLLKNKSSDSLENKISAMIINYDDPYGRRLIEKYKDDKDINLITFGFSVNSSFRACNSKSKISGNIFKLQTRQKSYLVKSPLIGDFNILNTLAGICVSNVLKFNLRESLNYLENCPQTPGRMERIGGTGLGVASCNVFVDYAHTPDALENILVELKKLKQKRLIVIFGAGGDRDRSKRKIMGRVASNNSDVCVITSDNPRSEDPKMIIDDIYEGVSSKSEIDDRSVIRITDRLKAIEETILSMRPGDIVVIAGKGHEDYQEIDGEKVFFSDVEVAEQCMLRLKEQINAKRQLKQERFEKLADEEMLDIVDDL